MFDDFGVLRSCLVHSSQQGYSDHSNISMEDSIFPMQKEHKNTIRSQDWLAVESTILRPVVCSRWNEQIETNIFFQDQFNYSS